MIKALNADLPFDQFVIEQIAGDMLPSATRDQIVATGFHRNTLRNEEGGTDREQFRVEAVVDRVNTTGSAFLGLTIGCAQCHDHKYDPLSQREYYQLFAFYNNASEPTLTLTTPSQKQKLDSLAAQIRQTEEKLKQFDAKEQIAWEAGVAAGASEWIVLKPVEFESSAESEITRLDDQSLLVQGGKPVHDTYTVTAHLPKSGITAVRLEVLTHEKLPKSGPGLAANGNFVLGEFQLAVESTDQPTPPPITWQTATTDFAQDAFKVAGTIDGNPKTGWGIYGGTSKNHNALFQAEQPIDAPDDSRLIFKLIHNAYNPSYKIGRFRLSVTTSPAGTKPVSSEVLKAAQTPKDKRTKQQKDALTKAYHASSLKRQPLQKRVDGLKQELAALKKSVPSTLVMSESSARETHIHIRGDFLKKGQKVTPTVPEILPSLSPDNVNPNRLDLARWLVDPKHPLTPRVTVNRFWQRLFGVGLVETENDFGTQGTAPTHPKLHDWLANEIVQQEWSVKRLLRRIIISSTFRQSSHARPDLDQVDPKNRLLARQRRLRLEAESVRDVALSTSGLLSDRIGGPGVYPPQPKGLDVFTQAKKNWRDSMGPSRYRRGMYTFFWRSNPHPFLMSFDAPDGNAACTRRIRSNTPLQALTLANDVTFIEMAKGVATRVLVDIPADTHRQIEYMFRRCLTRSPTEFEREVLLEFLDSQRNEYADSLELAKEFVPDSTPNGVDQADAAAWTSLARLLMNLDEFITRE